jgi:hypothetical protein
MNSCKVTSKFSPNSVINNCLNGKFQTASVNVIGTGAAPKQRTFDINSYIINKGQPHIFLTVNPSDVHSPLILFIGGETITPKLLDTTRQSTVYRAKFVQKNPVLQAICFDHIIQHFLSELLGYPNRSGVLGNYNGSLKLSQ